MDSDRLLFHLIISHWSLAASPATGSASLPFRMDGTIRSASPDRAVRISRMVVCVRDWGHRLLDDIPLLPARLILQKTI
jgi:hypothetical protein